MPVDPDITNQQVVTPPSAEIGRPDTPQVADPAWQQDTATPDQVDKQYWLACLDDAERAERDWRQRAKEIIEIYRNEGRSQKTGKLTAGPITFNILYANTEVTLPAIYQKPPQPVVRSRFVKASTPAPPMPMMPPPGMVAQNVPPGPLPPVPSPETQPAAAAGLPPGASLDLPGGGPPSAQAIPPSVPSPGLPPIGGPPPMAGMAGPPSLAPGGPPPGSVPAPGRPDQRDVETAAAVMENALQIVLDDDQSNEAIKMAIKDVLLAGRGVCRVRWSPQMQAQPMPGGPLPDGTAPTQDVKIWEEVNDEYVYWQDLLIDPTRSTADVDWVAFRHLFTRQALEREFSDSRQYQALASAGKLSSIFVWTDESAAKSPPGGGSGMKSAKNLGDHRKKAMVWEIWDRTTRQIIWMIREVTGLVLRVDPDSYQLSGFYPIPIPMLAVTTTDSRIPRPYYDIYAQ